MSYLSEWKKGASARGKLPNSANMPRYNVGEKLRKLDEANAAWKKVVDKTDAGDNLTIW